MKVTRSAIKLYASAKAVITQFLFLPGKDRVYRVIKRLRALPEDEAKANLQNVINAFATRHRDIRNTFSDHFNRINHQYKDELVFFSESKRMLLGAYFTKEYSIQAAALFNPSIVRHPDQSGLQPGEQRFVMSLRATGEGHISSVVFRTGIVNRQNDIQLHAPTPYFTRLEKNQQATYGKSFLAKRVSFFPEFDMQLLSILPDTFTAREAIQIFNEHAAAHPLNAESIQTLTHILDTNYELESSTHLAINEKVIFPNASAESMGMEDVRFVKFEDGEAPCYYGTYTAYNGHQIRTQLIATKDFDVFKIRTLYGDAISDKGMALFPEKINGKYVMISRQGGENVNIMFSDDLYVWSEFKTLMEPLYNWEFVQLGNCGSPIKTEKGWLLLTHGVGAIRTYVISAVLLDLDDPCIITGRLNKPILQADGEEREGYVPNVVYTCGLLHHNDTLIIPYAVSDSATGFATIALNEILDELISK